MFRQLNQWRRRGIVLLAGIGTGVLCWRLAAALPYIGFSLTGVMRGIVIGGAVSS